MSGGRPNRLKGRTRAELVELVRAGELAFDEGAFKNRVLCTVADCKHGRAAATRQQVRVRTASRGTPCCWRCRTEIEEAAAQK